MHRYLWEVSSTEKCLNMYILYSCSCKNFIHALIRVTSALTIINILDKCVTYDNMILSRNTENIESLQYLTISKSFSDDICICTTFIGIFEFLSKRK